ncbi:MAG TPA: beta-aspartyl-peptidase [Clostridiaceae bacterium]|nr:beta-aspartyl-peptidase [Clostridiaceae bacterium]
MVNSKDQEGISEGTLSLYAEDLVEFLKQDERIESCEVELAKPGESTRILPVKDVIEPRAKEEGDLFSGIDGEFREAGTGTTIALSGCAVVTTGSIVGFQEGIIDMSGPLEQYSPFSKLFNIVLVIEKKEYVDPHEHEEVVRLAGLKAAQYIGKLGRGVEPDSCEVWEWKSIPEKVSEYPQLPKVVYLYLCMAQGLLHNTYFYGENAQHVTPLLISPTEVFDGAIVSGNCVSPGSKNTTYHHQNNAVIKELLRQHGKELNLVGIILSPLSTMLATKYRNAIQAVKYAEFLGAEGALVSQEGFGNPTTDLMLICRQLEEKGIKTVIISNEDAGVDGYSESLPDGTREADAIISTGNSNATIHLPAMEKTIGDLRAIEKVTGGFVGSIQEDGSLVVEVHGIMGSHNLLGDTYLSAVRK